MVNLPTLYKRTSTGATQQWTIEIEGNKYRTVSGQIDGKKTQSKWSVCEIKNEGKVNETTAEEQATRQATALWDKKKKSHYFENIDHIDKVQFVKAMLAHKYEAYPDIDFTNAYCQPKLDGIRCLVNKDGMWSRGGKPIPGAPHIFEALKPLFDECPEMVLDGELYNHDLKEDFNKIVSLVKKAKPDADRLAESAELVEYWVYDVAVDSGGADFTERFHYLTLLGQINKVVVTPTFKVESQEELDAHYSEFMEAGYEGQMIRKGDSLYEGKRSRNLLKRKDFLDDEFEIVAINEGKGNWTGYAKSVSYVDSEGRTFDTGIKGNQDYCKQLLKDADKMIGKMATVRYQNLTPAGVPRFGVCYHIHETERM